MSGEDEQPRLFTAEECQAIAAEAVANAMALRPRSSTCAPRKPDLPAFDRKNVEIWIQRVEAAYARNDISTNKDKFAFLENKFPVDFNPRINSFLFSPPTTTSWDEFTAYLREEYGRTRRQMAATLIDGIKRDGLRPSQFFAKLTNLSRDATVDDVRKELLLRELPSSVRHTLSQQLESQDGEQLALLADSFFDRDGRPLHSSNASSTNLVSHASDDLTEGFTALYVDDESRQESEDFEVNNVNRPGRSFPKTSSSSSRSKSRPPRAQSKSSSSNSSAPSAREPKNPASFSSQPADQCWYHWKFGREAKQCQPGCKWAKSQGNGRVGSRK